jgi:predicted small lipoprotein YifL
MSPVRRSHVLPRLLALVASSLAALTLAGCGQTGPLVLPGAADQGGASQGAVGGSASTGAGANAGPNQSADDDQSEDGEENGR